MKNTHYDPYSFPDEILCFQDNKKKRTPEQLHYTHISETNVCNFCLEQSV